MNELVVAIVLFAALWMIAIGTIRALFGEERTRRNGWMWIVRGVMIIGVVMLIGGAFGCAPPPDNTARIIDLRDAVVPPTLWSGADHPEWASCRYEPPSALCTEVEP